ncbi:MAG: NUDIX hydrolase [Acidimicrobiales bacterium]|nr:NUDIX hydrolase [Acidimicrobiales bacterium]
MGSSREVVRAAGGVVWRPGKTGDEVLVVHRSRYDDWTLPKGKLDPGESWEQAAVREVYEETAVVPVLGRELAGTDYEDQKGRPKKVRYWAMAVAAEGTFVPGEEVSACEWLRVDAAAGRLTYGRDVEVLESFRDLRSSDG